MMLRGIICLVGGWKYHTGAPEWPWSLDLQNRGKFNISVHMVMHFYTNNKISYFTWRPAFGNEWGGEISEHISWSQDNVKMEVTQNM